MNEGCKKFLGGKMIINKLFFKQVLGKGPHAPVCNAGTKKNVVLCFLCVLLVFPLWCQDEPAINPGVSIDQHKLEAGQYTLRKVLESGGQFFNVPYIPFDKTTGIGDGYGEGPNGPRSGQIRAFYPQYPNYYFLRFNGLGAQSCYECHNSIGTYVPPGAQGTARIRKPGSMGGSGGFNSNAFINPKFPEPITFFIRNPPHVFGSGYTQSLAMEITGALFMLREAVRIKAKQNPNQQQTVQLTAKGIDFGIFKTTYNPKSHTAQVLGCIYTVPGMTINWVDYGGEIGFTDDVSGVTGVVCDLVVRPFQWKGISSSVRHFARDALDFHFSMQAVEKYGNLDCDMDGKIREMTLGNVSALVAFATMTRPPDQQIPPGKEKIVKRGYSIFTGQASDVTLYQQMCANCHMPTFRLDNALLFIDNPGPANVTQADCATLDAGLVTPVGSSSELEAYKRLHRRIKKVSQAIKKNRKHPGYKILKSRRSTAEEIANALKAAVAKDQAAAPVPEGYGINLTNPSGNPDLPSYIYPRLTANRDGSVDITLYSDLRTHNMGTQLADIGAQGTDVAAFQIPAPLFLTRPLWGVADTGPWLHDGRALTLKDAIMDHAGKGSEANPVIHAFMKLNRADQRAVVEFLRTLRLPIAPNLQGK
jgi:hypothetical protein